MLLWLQENIGTILVCLVLLVIVGLVVGKMIKDKRQGKSSCSCGCSNCGMQGHCHGK
jgi:hypothetical protein